MINSFKKLVDWSESNYSQLPWRKQRSLYSTLVSEIMLQQTTVGTVLNHYPTFMKKYPDLNSLSSVSEEELRYAWKGLGYYRRASNLLKAVRFLKDKPFPEKEEELTIIPGIGPYTASAIRSIGHNLPAIAVDGNLKRVLSRHFAIDTPYEKGLEKDIKTTAAKHHFEEILEALGSRRINEALMDLGRTVCKSKNPECENCPLNSTCNAFESGEVDKYPIKLKNRKTALSELHLVRYIAQKDNSVLLYRKEKGEWLEGQWELPTLCIETNQKDFKQYPFESQKIPQQKPLKTGITKYKIHNYTVFSCRNEIIENISVYKKRSLQFFELKNLPHASTASIKILKKAGLL